MYGNRRLPAEWEPQDGVMLAWPHEQTDWKDCLEEVVTVYCDLVRTISRFEKVLIIAPQADPVQGILAARGIDLAPVTVVELSTNDTWCRDFGPITVIDNDRPLILDFGFNGWGLKFAANFDNMVTRGLVESRIVRGITHTPGLVLEGGSIESDGQGTLLTTSACLLEENRNPHLTRADLEQQLMQQLGAHHLLWLDHGNLAGDDTDSHIDTLVRFAPDDTLLYVRCDDPEDEHYPDLKAMEHQLKTLRTSEEAPFNLAPLPWPRAIFDAQQQRLPATYANFLVINNAVLVPTYNDPADELALDAIRAAFPGHEVIGIDCRTLILQHGSLHCITMQLPKGVLS